MQRAQKRTSVDERCAFPLKLITITYRSLISVRLLRTCDTVFVPVYGNVHTMKCIAFDCFGAVHLLFDKAKTFLCDQRGDQATRFAQGNQWIWWRSEQSDTRSRISGPKAMPRAIHFQQPNYLLNSFSQRINEPFARITLEYLFFSGSINRLPFCLSLLRTPMQLICSHFVTFL